LAAGGQGDHILRRQNLLIEERTARYSISPDTRDAPYSITSSARASSVGGTMKPHARSRE